ncbi:nucleotidyltransferase domain-containing protein [Streptomyces sp. NPDC020801]|uniref:nucleotidyltransferase domain-containing protein n=1 Tax=unclassified Streptomyces TaxID=2593676 RepID=UPI00378EC1AF
MPKQNAGAGETKRGPAVHGPLDLDSADVAFDDARAETTHPRPPRPLYLGNARKKRSGSRAMTWDSLNRGQNRVIPHGCDHVIPQVLGAVDCVTWTASSGFRRRHRAPCRRRRWLLRHRLEKLSGVSTDQFGKGAFEVHRDDRSVGPPSVLSPERVAEIDDVIDRITHWAAGLDDIVGVLLVGSCARNAARPDSDIDIVLLTTDEPRYLLEDAWAVELGLGNLIRAQSWGPITERRHPTDSGLEVELGIGSPAWAKTDPVDPGTHRVVTDGARVLHDPAGILADLLAAVS